MRVPKVLSMFLAACFVAGMALLAQAGVYTTPQSHLLDTDNYVDLDSPSPPYNPNGGTLHDRAQQNPGVRFTISIDVDSGWGDIQIGDGFDHPSDNSGLATGFANMGSDFSSFSSYEMYIHNPNDFLWFMAALYMNTGWTDQGETDRYYQDTKDWTWVAPSSTVRLTLDFSSAAYWNGSSWESGKSVQNLSHVSNVGFKIGLNVGEEWNWYTSGDHFYVDAYPVPLPSVAMASLALFGGFLITGVRSLRR